MFLSLLRLNPRSRKAMTEASRPYELHRTLMKAFPEQNVGGSGHVLFRLDTDRETGTIHILVQSDNEPRWTDLNGTSNFVTECQHKEFNPALASGQVLRFRLRANPTKRAMSTGKREGILNTENQINWLHNKGRLGGFDVIEAVAINEGFARDKKTDNNNTKHDVTMFSVLFDGVLRITDEDVFSRTLKDGIGPAKGFGFGLLSIAPLGKEA